MLDADRIAREVVEPGTPGLAAVRERFGAGVVTAEGTLDRAALGAIVFSDADSRRALEDITHPLIAARTAALAAAASPETLVVHDIPLLVETGKAPTYHLVVAVDVTAEERVRRLVESRGMVEADAYARISHQASREDRLAVADIVLDNNGSVADLVAQVDRLWRRVSEYDVRLRAGDPVPLDRPVPVTTEPSWPDQSRRALARLAHRLRPLLGEGMALDHVGPTAVPGLPAPDVLHLQVGLPSDEDAGREDVPAALLRVGYVPVPDQGTAEARHLSCDPGRPAVVWLRVAGAPGWRTALLARDWLRAEPGARADLARSYGRGIPDGGAPPQVAPPQVATDGFPAGWWESVAPQAEAWAARTGWAAAGGHS